MSNYARKLSDPRWQKKRLEVLQRDNFKCKNCGCGDRELHVHHIGYGHGEIWETALELLETLCYECHSEEERQLKLSLGELIKSLRNAGFTSNDIYHLSDLVNDKFLRQIDLSGIFQGTLRQYDEGK